MEKGKPIIYVDGFGREHEALVTAINGLHPDHASVVFVDLDAPEAENVKKIFDVVHISQAATETNPNLPDFHVHVLKEVGDDHVAPPADHPQHDHPFASQIDTMHAQLGIQRDPVTPSNRPEFYGAIQAHLGATEDTTPVPPVLQGDPSEPQSGVEGNAALPSAADLDAVAAEQKAAERTGIDGPLNAAPGPLPISGGVVAPATELVVETKTYSDGTVATGVAPLPDQSPAQQDAAKEPDVTTQLDADVKAGDSDATGSK